MVLLQIVLQVSVTALEGDLAASVVVPLHLTGAQAVLEL